MGDVSHPPPNRTDLRRCENRLRSDSLSPQRVRRGGLSFAAMRTLCPSATKQEPRRCSLPPAFSSHCSPRRRGPTGTKRAPCQCSVDRYVRLLGASVYWSHNRQHLRPMLARDQPAVQQLETRSVVPSDAHVHAPYSPRSVGTPMFRVRACPTWFPPRKHQVLHNAR